jgi:ATP-dependent DNA helicase RecG
VEKISEACKAANLPEPQFSERSGGFLVELMQGKERLGNQLDKTQIAILTKMKIDPKISGVKLAEELGISSTAIEKQIKKLQGTGIVKRIGGTRGYWEVRKAI